MECQTHTNNIATSQEVSFDSTSYVKPEIHQFDVGTKFMLEILDQEGEPVDLTTATSVTLKFKKPDYTTFIVSGFIEDINKVNYFSQFNDLDLVGDWKVQAQVVLPGKSWNSTIAEFEVHKNL